jgi:hypothetical protein
LKVTSGGRLAVVEEVVHNKATYFRICASLSEPSIVVKAQNNDT